MSAATTWRLLSADLSEALKEHAEKTVCKSSDYINLHFKVKTFYDQFVADVPQIKDSKGFHSSFIIYA